jgi:hypothetical protein
MSSLAEEAPDVRAAVDDALRSFPLAPAPAGLAPAVLAAVRTTERATTRPVFPLRFVDFALSGFMALMLGLVLLLFGWLTPAAGRVQAVAAGSLMPAEALAWGLALGGVVLTLGLLLLASLVFRPRQPLTRI